MRYSDDRKHAHNTGGVYFRDTSTLVNPASFYDFHDTASFDAWTPKVSVQVQAAPDTFIYLSATRGFKSGGFNPTANRTGLAYAPEFVWSYEGGFKRTMAGGRVRVNTAAFYSDYQDLQVQTLVQTGIFFVSTGAATIKGLEVETVAAAGRGLQVMGQFAWLDATFDRFLAVRPGYNDRSGRAWESSDVCSRVGRQWLRRLPIRHRQRGDDVPPRRPVLAGACVLHGVQRLGRIARHLWTRAPSSRL